MPRLHLAVFQTDATVPIGHSLCGGWIKPAERITEPLLATGVVLLGEEAPVVLCAIDWTGICNGAHVYLRSELAAAAHTTPERVAVHTVHQHNAPFVDLDAQRLVSEVRGLPPIVDREWFEGMAGRLADAVRGSLGRAAAVSQVGFGQAAVKEVASNRRVLGPDGRIKYWRASACKDAAARAQPEGLIDPMLKTLCFFDGGRKLATLHYYAVHPMSYYGDGLVTSDFVGIARERRTAVDRSPHLYFTGCAGNIAAGKYNDGSHPQRGVLAERIHQAMVESEQALERIASPAVAWRSEAVLLPARAEPADEALRATIADADKPTAARNRSALELSYRRRVAARTPIVLSSLGLSERVCIVHLPGESFIEYQLYAQELRPKSFVACAAYGDDGPWYLPLARHFPEGGYEPGVAFAGPGAEELLRGALRKVLG